MLHNIIKKFTKTTCIFSLLLIASFEGGCSESDNRPKYQKLNIQNVQPIDGDTFRYTDEQNVLHIIRLWGLDADEVRQQCNEGDMWGTANGYKHSIQFGKLLEETKDFECYFLKKKDGVRYQTDRWGREYAVCRADGENLLNILGGTKVLTNSNRYSYFIKPLGDHYGHILQEVLLDAAPAIRFAEDVGSVLHLLIEHAKKHDLASQNTACFFKTPAQWRAYSRLQMGLKKEAEDYNSYREALVAEKKKVAAKKQK